MANYRYYLGPLQYGAIGKSPLVAWHAPNGVAGMIDLRSNPECASTTEQVPKSLLWSVDPLPSEYTLLGQGDIREILATAKMRQAWNSSLGVTPLGDKLIDLLIDHLTRGADPAGLDACKPLAPNGSLDLEIWMPGHSKVWSEKFDWKSHRHAAKLKDLLRADAKELKEQLPQAVYEKWLGDVERKYKGKIASEVDADARPRKPETALLENFAVGDTGTLGGTYTWTETNGTWAIVSQRAELTSGEVWADARCEQDLSGTDHHAIAQVAKLASGSGNFSYMGAAIRCSSSARTHYAAIGANNEDQILLDKVVGGTRTGLGTASISISLPQPCRCSASGSSISGLWNSITTVGPVTDTAISTGTRGGLAGNGSAAPDQATVEWWSAEDEAAAGNRRRRVLICGRAA